MQGVMLPKNVTEMNIKNENALLFLQGRTDDLDVQLMRINNPAFLKLRRKHHKNPPSKLHTHRAASLQYTQRVVPYLFPEEIRPEMKRMIAPFQKNTQRPTEESGRAWNASDTIAVPLGLVKSAFTGENNKNGVCDPLTTEFDVPPDLSGYGVKRQGGDFVCDGRVVEPMTDSSELLHGGAENALYERFKKDGYLCFRKLLNRDEILESKTKIYKELRKMGFADETDLALSKTGWTLETKYGTIINGTKEFSEDSNMDEMEKWRKIGSNKEIEALSDCNALRVIISMLSSGKSNLDNCINKPRAFDPNYTWIRIKAPGECTVNHADHFYFMESTEMFSHPGTHREFGGFESNNFINDEERFSVSSLRCYRCNKEDRDEKLLLCDECNDPYHMDSCLDPPIEIAPEGPWFCPTCKLSRPTLGTCWIPLGDVDVDHGVLAVLSGSHHLPNFEAKLRKSQIPKSFFAKTEFNRKLVWKTGAFSAGDCVFFDSKLIHCSSKNYERTYRISLDFRWYIEPIGRANCLETNQGKFVRALSRAFDIPRAQLMEFQDNRKRIELLKVRNTNNCIGGGNANRKLNELYPSLKHKNPKELSNGHGLMQMTRRTIRCSSKGAFQGSKFISKPSSNVTNPNPFSMDVSIQSVEIPVALNPVRPSMYLWGSKRKNCYCREKCVLSNGHNNRHDKIVQVVKETVHSFNYWRNFEFVENKLYINQVNKKKKIRFDPDLKDLEFLYLLASFSERET